MRIIWCIAEHIAGEIAAAAERSCPLGQFHPYYTTSGKKVNGGSRFFHQHGGAFCFAEAVDEALAFDQEGVADAVHPPVLLNTGKGENALLSQIFFQIITHGVHRYNDAVDPNRLLK